MTRTRLFALALVAPLTAVAVAQAAPTSVCPGGRYVVDGDSLIPGGAADGQDAT